MEQDDNHSNDALRTSPLLRRLMLTGVFVTCVSGILGSIFIPPIVFKNKCRDHIQRLLKTPVEIGSAEISFFMDEGAINNLTVYNPEGYPKRPFLFVPKVSFKKQSSHETDGVSNIELIELHNPVMYLDLASRKCGTQDSLALDCTYGFVKRDGHARKTLGTHSSCDYRADFTISTWP